MPLCFAESICWLFAQNAPAAPAAGGGGGELGSSPLSLGLYALVFILWFYFLLIRPQQRQEKARKALISAIKKNDKILTSAGIYGTVVSIDTATDRVVVRVDDDKGIKMVFTKASVVQVLAASTEKPAVQTEP